jgi:Ser/Thr protein kinase RdoA (MazF antagonist)
MPEISALLTAVADAFGVDAQSIRHAEETEEGVYSCRKGSRAYLLRVLRMPPGGMERLAARMAYAHFLAENGVSISLPAASPAGRAVEIIPGADGEWTAMLTPLASGSHPSPRNAYLWNERLFTAWGQLMGRMHALARGCPLWRKEAGSAMGDWREEFDSFAAKIQEERVRARWQALLEPLSALPVERDGYGLVHNDLTHWNFLYHPDAPGPGPITVTDFGACGFHWFAQDLAIPLYHAVTENGHGGAAQRQTIARGFLQPFLAGYQKENDLDPAWLDSLGLFLTYREILVYLALSEEWPAARRTRWQSKLLAEKRARITRGEAVIPAL